MNNILVIGTTEASDQQKNIGDAFFDSIGGVNAKAGIDNWKARHPLKFALDVTDTESVEKYLTRNGPWDEIVYCAGLNQLAWADQLSMGLMSEIFQVNAFGIVNVLGAHKALFPAHPVSAVIVTSDAGHNPMRGSTAYCSSKAAADMVVRCLAREWGSDGWRVNAVAPAMVADTPMTTYIDEAVPGFRGWTPEYAAAYEASQLQGRGRITKAEVVAGIWSVLRGPKYMNGAILDLSGGK